MFAGGAAVASTSSVIATLRQVEGEDSSSWQGEEQPEMQAD